MPKKFMKIIWKVLKPGSYSSSPSSPPPQPTPSQPSPVAGGTGSGSGFALPVDCPETQGWGENPHIYSRWGYPGHNGRDFGCPLLTPIHQAGDGYIDRIGFEADGYGVYVRVDHGTFWIYYCHLNESSVRYSVGTWVHKGFIVALVGSTGFSTGPHLHWGARRKVFDSADPYKGYFDPMELVLSEAKELIK